MSMLSFFRRPRAGMAIAALLVFALVAGALPRPSLAVLPDWLTTEIAHIAEAYAASGEDGRLEPGNAELQADLDWRIQRDNLSALVVTSIAELPGQAGEIVAAAIYAAPDFRDTVVRDALLAYPSFAQTIRAAAAEPERFLTTPLDDVREVEPNTQFVDPDASLGPTSRAETPPAADDPYADDIGDDFADSFDDDYGDEDFDDLVGADGADDPLEGFNRAIFWFNDIVDQAILRPIAWTYGFIMPEVVKQPIRNGFRNLGAPLRFINDMLQGEVTAAGVTGARFIINSTVGVAGLFDIAGDAGLEHQPSDFGQTLYTWGIDSGPYVVLPFFGPSTVRDTVGLVTEFFLDPVPYAIDDSDISLGLTIAGGIVKREEVIDDLDALRENSLDYYAALRSAYLQNRAAQLRRGVPLGISDSDAAFAEFE